MMYGYFWRRLPGPVPVRIGICLALLALVVAVCFAWLFPWVCLLYTSHLSTARSGEFPTGFSTVGDE